MLPYYFLVCAPLALFTLYSYFNSSSQNKNKRTLDVFFLIWLLLLVFRAESVGYDLPVYKDQFLRYSRLEWKYIFAGVLSDQFELGYVLISKLVSYFTSDFRWVLIVCALIAVIPIWGLYRKERHAALLIVAFINIAPFSMYFSGLRQAMAMGFSCVALQRCREKKWLRFLLVVFVAYLFHKSALILLLMYPVYRFHLRRRLDVLYIVPVIASVYVFNKPIFEFLLLFTQKKYIERYGDAVHSTGAYSVLLLLIALLIFAFLVPDQDAIDSDTIGLRNILVLSALLQTFAGVHSIAMRMNYYYLLLVPLAVSHVIDNSRRNAKLAKIAMLCMAVFFGVYFFYHAYTDADILEVFPYQSMFEG